MVDVERVLYAEWQDEPDDKDEYERAGRKGSAGLLEEWLRGVSMLCYERRCLEGVKRLMNPSLLSE